MSNDTHAVGRKKNLSEVWSHITQLYDLAHGLRFIQHTLDEEGHDAAKLLALTSDKLLDIASDFDDAIPKSMIHAVEDGAVQ